MAATIASRTFMELSFIYLDWFLWQFCKCFKFSSCLKCTNVSESIIVRIFWNLQNVSGQWKIFILEEQWREISLEKYLQLHQSKLMQISISDKKKFAFDLKWWKQLLHLLECAQMIYFVPDLDNTVPDLDNLCLKKMLTILLQLNNLFW